MTQQTIPDEQLLLSDYQHFRDLFVENEAIGEKRVNFFITLTTAILAGVITLITTDLPVVGNLPNAAGLVLLVLLGNLLFGIVTLARIRKRNLVTDEYKAMLDYIRQQLRNRSVGLEKYELPFTSSPTFALSGGLSEMVAAMNSLIVAVLVAVVFPFAGAWILGLIALVLTFIFQKVVLDSSRAEPTQPNNQPKSQHFRAGTGAVILNPDLDRVLIFKRVGSAGDWQFPQGGLDISEEPLVGVLREIHEETGIHERDLEQLPIQPKLLAYEIPAAHRRPKTGRGQTQWWYFFKFVGDESAISLGDEEEFSDWRWASMDEAVEGAIAFKREVYEGLRAELVNKALNK